jgi:HEPN domain-containing protein
MTKRRGIKNISHSKYAEYLKVAEHFLKAANDSMELEYWTAAGVLVVHSAIAFADALCIKMSGVKSIGENHEETISLLEEAVSNSDEKKKAINQLKRIIEEKNKVSYMGELYSPAQTKDLLKRLERFSEWVKKIIN